MNSLISPIELTSMLEVSGHSITDHFVDVNKMITLGKYASYLIALNTPASAVGVHRKIRH